MDRQEKMKAKEGSENGSENGSNDDSDTEEKVCHNFIDHINSRQLHSNWSKFIVFEPVWLESI